MTETTKTPQREQWWIDNRDGQIVYIVGHNRDGGAVYEDAEGWVDYLADNDWSDWHHEPRCDGFEWMEPTAETWPKYYVTILDSDGYYRCDSSTLVWYITADKTKKQHAVADVLNDVRYWKQVTESEAKSRLTPAEETFPQFWTTIDSSSSDVAYVKRVSADGYVLVRSDGTEQDSGRLWSSFDIEHRTRLTREQAEALLDKPEPAAKTQTIAVDPGEGYEWVPFGYILGNGDTVRDYKGSWIQTSAIGQECVIKNLYRRKITPPEPVESPDRVADKSSAHNVIRDIVYYLQGSDEGLDSPAMALETAQQWLMDNPEDADPPPFAKPFTDPRSGMGISKHDTGTEAMVLPREYPRESPDDWVTQDKCRARNKIDEFCWIKTGDNPKERDWKPCAGTWTERGVHGFDADGETLHLRCRRRDLPQPAPKRVPVRLWKCDKSGVIYDSQTQVKNDREVFCDSEGFFVRES